LRIDSHHSFSERYPLEHLGSILVRNRFEGSILVCESLMLPSPPFVKGIVVRTGSLDEQQLEEWQRHSLFRGVACDSTEGLLLLEKRGIPLDYGGALDALPRVAERHPRLRIAIDHLGSPAAYRGWDRELEQAARFENIFCKLSGLTRLAPSPQPYVQHALRLFGERRLMFGSDWPHTLPEHSWKASLAAFTQAIGAQVVEVREQLLGGTAARFYGLD
jgi:predicted TIM-barrel fold metal-dependent hydrolase